MDGANMPSGAVKGPIEDGSGWLDGIVCSLLAPQPARNRQHACLSFVRDAPANPIKFEVFFLRHTRERQALGAASHSPHPRPLRLDLCQVPGKVRRIVGPTAIPSLAAT
jgi:hypothetical protein